MYNLDILLIPKYPLDHLWNQPVFHKKIPKPAMVWGFPWRA